KYLSPLSSLSRIGVRRGAAMGLLRKPLPEWQEMDSRRGVQLMACQTEGKKRPDADFRNKALVWPKLCPTPFRLPWCSPDFEPLPRGARVLQVGPGQVAGHEVGSTLKDQVVVAGNADNVPGRLAAQPGAEVVVQPGRLEIQVVILDRGQVAGQEKQI